MSSATSRRLAEHFAGWRAIDITTVTVNAYIDLRRDQGAANATINRETGVLRRGFRLAVQMKLLSENHRPTIQMLSEDNARQGFLEPADFAALSTHLPPWLADATTFAYWSGWRTGRSRGAHLGRRHARRDGRQSPSACRRPRSKNKAPRTVVINSVVALAELLRRRQAGAPPGLPVRVSSRQRAPPRRLPRQLAPCDRAPPAGPSCYFHDLRRSAVRNLVRAGVPQARRHGCCSGHKSSQVFERYNIVDEKDLSAAVDTLDRYMTARQQDAPTVVPLDAPGRGAADAHKSRTTAPAPRC